MVNDLGSEGLKYDWSVVKQDYRPYRREEMPVAIEGEQAGVPIFAFLRQTRLSGRVQQLVLGASLAGRL